MLPPLVPVEEPPVHGQLFPREQEEEDPPAALVGLRLVLQPAVGAVTAGLVGYVSLYPSFILVLPFCLGPIVVGPQNKTCDTLIYTGAALGASIGAGVGVLAIGHLFSGRGRFPHTMVGAFAGTVIGGIAGLSTDAPEKRFIALLVGAPAIGATVAYWLSDAFFSEPRRATARAEKSLSVLPVVTATRTGGLMGGLVGQF